jgi:pimeloyl-ACP methyl ester carboxylesterase
MPACTSADGTSIAYDTFGDGPPLVFAISWKTSIAEQFGSEASRPFYDGLASGRRSVISDRRGTGASQRDVTDFSLDAQVADLTAVADALGLDRFDLSGDNDGCYVAVAFAAQHRERVRRLVLWSPLVGGHDARQADMRDFAQRMRSDADAARWQWSEYTVNGDESARRAFVDAFAARSSPEVTASYLEWEAAEDASPLLPTIAVPALVINTRRFGPRSMGVASLMPDARFEPIDVDPAAGPTEFYGTVARTILAFLDEPRG